MITGYDFSEVNVTLHDIFFQAVLLISIRFCTLSFNTLSDAQSC